MGLTKDEIIAMTLVCLFYIVLLGYYTKRLYKKWCNRKKKTIDVEAQNKTETSETEELLSLSEPQSSSGSLVQIPKPSKAITKEPSQPSNQSSSSSKATDIETQNGTTTTGTTTGSSSPSGELVQMPKPCVLTTA